jgi:AbrB family looped-hinge helix DNA binding protein
MKDMSDGIQMFGTVKVGERGQIVIPKDAREKFGIGPGDLLMVVGNEHMGHLALIRADAMKDLARKILDGLGGLSD